MVLAGLGAAGGVHLATGRIRLTASTADQDSGYLILLRRVAQWKRVPQ